MKKLLLFPFQIFELSFNPNFDDEDNNNNAAAGTLFLAL
jgi:hypothetical protein